MQRACYYLMSLRAVVSSAHTRLDIRLLRRWMDAILCQSQHSRTDLSPSEHVSFWVKWIKYLLNLCMMSSRLELEENNVKNRHHKL